jgi:hypothetical protein
MPKASGVGYPAKAGPIPLKQIPVKHGIIPVVLKGKKSKKG